MGPAALTAKVGAVGFAPSGIPRFPIHSSKVSLTMMSESIRGAPVRQWHARSKTRGSALKGNNGQCHEVRVGFYSRESNHDNEFLSRILSTDVQVALNSTNRFSPPRVSADTSTVKAGRASRDASTVFPTVIDRLPKISYMLILVAPGTGHARCPVYRNLVDHTTKSTPVGAD